METLKKKLTLKLVSWLVAGALLLTGGANYLLKENRTGQARLVDSTGCKTASASTTLAWMTPGKGTTTNSCSVSGNNSVRVNNWLVASSTLTHYKFRVERSMDNKDWFQDSASLAINSTNTPAVNYSEFSHIFASTTLLTTGRQLEVNFSGTGTTSAERISFEVPTTGANYLRVISYLADADPAGNTSTSSDNGALWQQIIPQETNVR